jgi:hypothetical protein
MNHGYTLILVAAPEVASMAEKLNAAKYEHETVRAIETCTYEEADHWAEVLSHEARSTELLVVMPYRKDDTLHPAGSGAFYECAATFLCCVGKSVLVLKDRNHTLGLLNRLVAE